MALPQPVDEVVRTYLELADDAAPGLVEGLYLHGSVALDDFHPGGSDIDFVVLSPGRPDEARVAALAGIHDEMSRRHPRPYFDGIYLSRADLAVSPDECPDVPGVLQTTFGAHTRQALNPVTWHELAERGVVVRGPPIGELDVWTGQAALIDFTRRNLQTYWHGWIGSLERLPETLPERAADPWFVEWCVLGVARLHALLVTGRLHSKCSAGRFGLETLDRSWALILSEALRIRAGTLGESGYANPRERLRDTREFVAAMVGRHSTTA